MKELTVKQKDVLSYIKSEQEIKGFQPSLREVAEHFEMTVPSVMSHLTLATKKGYITRDKGTSRSIQFTDLYREIK